MVFHTQKHHVTIRKNCVDFLKKNRELFKSFVEGEFDQYLENLSNPNEWAGHMEMGALTLMYKRDFLVFQEVGKPPVKVTDNRFPDVIMLCYSHGNHYDSVYAKSILIDAAFCQSLVYGILYKRVFNLGDDVDLAVQRMLHDKSYSKQKRNSSLVKREVCKQTSIISNEEIDKEEAEVGGEIKKALFQGLPPFPYKVAKVLDPEIYRNVEYDLWNEIRKEQVRSEQLVIPDIIPGVKCLVRMEKSQFEMHAHVQEMLPNRGPVTVFIEELGEKKTVPYESLQPIPVPIYKALAMEGNGKKRAVHVFDSYFRSVQFPVDKIKGKKKFSRKTLKDLPMFVPIVQSTSVIHLTHTPVVSPSTPIRATYQKSHRQYLQGKDIPSTPVKEHVSKSLVPQHDTPLSPVNTSPLDIPYWNNLPNVFNMQQPNNGTTLMNTSVSTTGSEIDSQINRQLISMEVSVSPKEDSKLMDVSNENRFYSSNKILEMRETCDTTFNCGDLNLPHPLLPFQTTDPQSTFPYGQCPLCPCLVPSLPITEQNSPIQDISPSGSDAYGIRYMYPLGNDVPYPGQQGPMVTVPPPIWTYNGNFTYLVTPSPYGLCDCSMVDNSGTVMGGQNPGVPYLMMLSPPSPSMMNNSGPTVT